MVTKNYFYGLILFASITTFAFAAEVPDGPPGEQPNPIVREEQPTLLDLLRSLGTSAANLPGYFLHDFAYSPFAYLGLAGTARVAYACKDEPIALAGIGGAAALYSCYAGASWLTLRSELNALRRISQQGDRQEDLVTRNVWLENSAKESGYDLYQDYIRSDIGRKNRLKQIAVGQVKERNIQEALNAIQQQLVQYGKHSNILRILALAAHRHAPAQMGTADQDSLLNGPYLLLNNINEDDSPVKRAFQQATEAGSVISKSFKLRIKYWCLGVIPRPMWTTWTYTKASECIWELLHQYARLKAMNCIIENTSPDTRQSPLDVHLTVHRAAGQPGDQA